MLNQNKLITQKIINVIRLPEIKHWWKDREINVWVGLQVNHNITIIEIYFVPSYLRINDMLLVICLQCIVSVWKEKKLYQTYIWLALFNLINLSLNKSTFHLQCGLILYSSNKYLGWVSKTNGNKQKKYKVYGYHL